MKRPEQKVGFDFHDMYVHVYTRYCIYGTLGTHGEGRYWCFTVSNVHKYKTSSKCLTRNNAINLRHLHCLIQVLELMYEET